jgi:flagellar basal-body rod modification protein FlgD
MAVSTTSIFPSSPTPTTAQKASATASTLGLSNDDFLRLLVTQLKYQDPLQPFDQNQLLAQTAQLTSIEQLQALNGKFTELKDSMLGSDLTRAAGLLGRTAAVAGAQFEHTGTPVALPVTVLAPATEVMVDVFRDGTLVRTIKTGPLPAGAQAVTWDGLDDFGRSATVGTYTYHVSPLVSLPSAAPTVLAAAAPVTGFERRGSDVLFNVGGLLVRLEDIVAVQ